MNAAKLLGSLLLFGALPACSDETTPEEAAVCDAECLDQAAMRSMREIIKLVYNLTLQGNPVGEQDETTRCAHGGSARVRGVASSNALQGSTELMLLYELKDCALLRRDEDADENYDVTLNGVVVEQGTLAVQPTATTALIFEGEGLSLAGTVYDPPRDYMESDCAFRLLQNGNHLTGTWCGRAHGFDL